MLDTTVLPRELTGTVGLYKDLFDDTSAPLYGPAEIHQSPQVYLSDAHKLLRTDILTAMGPSLRDMQISDSYNSDALYVRYEVITSDSAIYESQADNNKGNELTNPLYWKKTSLLSIWYSRIERGGINKLGLALAQNPPAAPLLTRQPLFNKEGNIQGALNKLGRFLGLRLRVKGGNTALNIARFGLQLTGTGSVTNFPIYLFHSEQAGPVKVIRLSATITGRTLWVDVNQYIYKRVGGYYTIGYFESDLPNGISAVGAERGFMVGSCSSCDGVDYAYAENRVPFVHIQPIYVSGSLTSGVQSWVNESEVKLQTWGINMILEAQCDVTQTLLDNKQMLTNALLHVIACDVLEELSTSDRVNSVKAGLNSAAYVALYGQQNTKTDFGLTTKRDTLIKDLKAVMSKISSRCMPQEAPKKGIRFESMFD